MSSWILVTETEADESILINADHLTDIRRRKDCTALFQVGVVEAVYTVKESLEDIYAAIHGLPLAYLDHIKGAIVVEAHEKKLKISPELWTDEDISWAAFADAVVKRLRDV